MRLYEKGPLLYFASEKEGEPATGVIHLHRARLFPEVIKNGLQDKSCFMIKDDFDTFYFEGLLENSSF